MPRIPDRWLNYTWHGLAVADRFIALKVPLPKNFVVPDNERFTPEDVIEHLPVGLIIDLTNTKRYYKPEEFTRRGVEYKKLFVPGHVVPDMRRVQWFFEMVNGYLGKSENKGKLIGVHCTHGINRTGYLICAYLILELGYHPKDAVALFNEKRGHCMERSNYLESLNVLAAPPAEDRVRPNLDREHPYHQQEHVRNKQQRYDDDMNYGHSSSRLGGSDWRRSDSQISLSRSDPLDLGSWDPATRRVLRLPKGRYSGTAKRTVFE